MDVQALKLKAKGITLAARRTVSLAVEKAVSFMFWQVPHYSRWGMYPQALFVFVALVWFEYRPGWATQSPGVAMGFLAVAAIVMAVRGPDSTRIEGMVWIAISFFLFAGEMHFITVDRKAHDTEQAELRSREETTLQQQADAFARVIKQGNTLFSGLAEEQALTRENLKHLTGGDEYCWLVPMRPLPIASGGDPAYQHNNSWELSVWNSGRVVLPTCDINFVPTSITGTRSALLTYHFEKLPVSGFFATRTGHYIKGDLNYLGWIQTPTRLFDESITFEADEDDPTKYTPSCRVTELPSQKTLERYCNSSRIYKRGGMPKRMPQKP